MTEKTVYEWRGGVNALAKVVDRLSDETVDNPALNMNPELQKWSGTGQLAALKFMRMLWICEATGGPVDYTGKDLGTAYANLHITSGEFDMVGTEIQSALEYFHVPAQEQREVLAAIVAQKSDVVNAAKVGSAVN